MEREKSTLEILKGQPNVIDLISSYDGKEVEHDVAAGLNLVLVFAAGGTLQQLLIEYEKKPEPTLPKEVASRQRIGSDTRAKYFSWRQPCPERFVYGRPDGIPF
jgi:hypothetical protein